MGIGFLEYVTAGALNIYQIADAVQIFPDFPATLDDYVYGVSGSTVLERVPVEDACRFCNKPLATADHSSCR